MRRATVLVAALLALFAVGGVTSHSIKHVVVLMQEV